MIQGIEFYDISNNGQLDHISHFSLSQNAKANCVEAYANHAYFTSRNGLYVVDISNPSNPQNLGRVSGTNNLILENLDAENNLLAVAAHADGVLVYDISDPQNLELKSIIALFFPPPSPIGIALTISTRDISVSEVVPPALLIALEMVVI